MCSKCVFWVVQLLMHNHSSAPPNFPGMRLKKKILVIKKFQMRLTVGSRGHRVKKRLTRKTFCHPPPHPLVVARKARFWKFENVLHCNNVSVIFFQRMSQVHFMKILKIFTLLKLCNVNLKVIGVMERLNNLSLSLTRPPNEISQIT